MTYFGTRQPRYGLTSRTARTAYAIVLSYSGANFMLWPVAMKRLFKQGICLSGWGDLNSRPSVPQITEICPRCPSGPLAPVDSDLCVWRVCPCPSGCVKSVQRGVQRVVRSGSYALCSTASRRRGACLAHGFRKHFDSLAEGPVAFRTD